MFLIALKNRSIGNQSCQLPNMCVIVIAFEAETNFLSCVCVFACRPGVWFSDAKAPVYVWRQQQSPGACREDTEHLVPTTGARPEGTVWGTTWDKHGHRHHTHKHTHIQYVIYSHAILILPDSTKKNMIFIGLSENAEVWFSTSTWDSVGAEYGTFITYSTLYLWIWLLM